MEEGEGEHHCSAPRPTAVRRAGTPSTTFPLVHVPSGREVQGTYGCCSTDRHGETDLCGQWENCGRHGSASVGPLLKGTSSCCTQGTTLAFVLNSYPLGLLTACAWTLGRGWGVRRAGLFPPSVHAALFVLPASLSGTFSELSAGWDASAALLPSRSVFPESDPQQSVLCLLFPPLSFTGILPSKSPTHPLQCRHLLLGVDTYISSHLALNTFLSLFLHPNLLFLLSWL